MLVQRGSIAELTIVGIGAVVEVKRPDDVGYITAHTTTEILETFTVVGPVDVQVTGATFWTSATGAKAALLDYLTSGGGGPAPSPVVAYLLRALFGGRDITNSNNDVYSEGRGKLISTDTGTGTSQITSNVWSHTNPSAAATGMLYSGSTITRAAGKKVIVTGRMNVASGTQNMAVVGLNNDQTTGGTWQAYVGFSGLQDATTGGAALFSNATSSQTIDTTALITTDNTDTTFAAVLGGFTSGAPDAAGTEGVFGFMNNAGTWTLIGVQSQGSGNPYYKHRNFNSTADHYINDITVPTAADATVFTPTNYVLDLAAGTGNLTATAADSGQTWVSERQVVGPITRNGSGAFTITGDGAYEDVVIDTGISDVFIQMNETVYNTGGLSIGFINFRWVDTNNLWQLYARGDTNQLSIFEKTGGSTAVRASSTPTIANGESGTVSLRVKGTTIEGWWKGGNKVSYTSASHQTATKHGLELYRSNLTVSAPVVQDFYLLPLTAAEYDTAFDTGNITASDCDLYQNFDLIDDVTLTDGNIIASSDGDIERGRLVSVDSTSGNVKLLSEKLEIVSDGGTGPDALGFYVNNPVTREAGKMLKWTHNVSTVASSTALVGMNTSASIAAANRVWELAVSSAGELFAFANGGSSAYIWSAPSILINTDYDLAVTHGGFDSAGVPDATGDYGELFFWYNGANWELLGADPSLNTATMYVKGRGANASNATTRIDDLVVPTAADTTVFTPTNYTKELFTGTDDDLLTSRASDSGHSWTVIPVGTYGFNHSGVSPYIKGNKLAPQTGGGSTDGAYFDNSVADHFTSVVWTHRYTDASNHQYGRLFLRYVDNQNLFGLYYSTTTITLAEVSGGVFTSRGSAAFSPSNGATYLVTARCEGNVYETWVAGGNKVSYTDTNNLMNTETKSGVGIYLLGSSGGSYLDMDNYIQLPLTAAEYDTALGAALPAAEDSDILATFTGLADQTLLGGATLHDDYGYIQDGSLKVINSVGAVSANSDRMRLLGNNNWGGTGLVGNSVTPVAGTFMTCTADITSFAVNNCSFGFNDNSGSIALANWKHTVNFSAATGWTYRPDTTTGPLYVTNDYTHSPGTPEGFAIVLGGYDSSGNPDPTGTYGASFFRKNTTAWELQATDPNNTLASTRFYWAQYGAGGTNYCYLDDLKLPTSDTVADGVFTPTNYVADTFTDTNGTALTAHTADSGGSWSGSFGSSLEIQSNNVQLADYTTDTDSMGYTDTGEADVFITARSLFRHSNPLNTHYNSILYRYVDDNNYWIYSVYNASSTKGVNIQEKTGGTVTTRASTTHTLADNVEIIESVRASGNTHEAWLNGGSKLSYTSAIHNTATKHGVYIFQNDAKTPHFKNWMCMPITSATYTTELDGA